MKVSQNNDADAHDETRKAYHAACDFLGYTEPSREADDVIDHLGAMEDGKRGGRLASFYPEAISAAVDRAARLARTYPEALLSDAERGLLDLVLRTVTP